MTAASDTAALIAQRPASVGRMFFDRVAATPDREAYSYPSDEGWKHVTWRQTGDAVTRLAAGLIALGVQPEQRVAIASGTRFEWVLADLAIMSSGAATTTVYPSTIADDVAYILSDSASRVVFAEDDVQIAKLRERRGNLPLLSKIVTFDGTTDGDWVIGLDGLEKLGDEVLAADPDAVAKRVTAADPGDLATLIYTSGTTGRPKGVRLPHSAWTYEGVAIEATGLLSADDLQFLWLPLAHSFGKVLLSAQLAIGFPTAIDGAVDKIVDNLATVKPTFMGAAPRIFEKAHARIVTMTSDEGGLRKVVFDRAFAVGLTVAGRRQRGEPIPSLLAAQHAIFDRLVFAKIRARFGGRLRFFVSGAAALNRDLAEWFNAAGIVILEGYGLTETSAGSCVNRPSLYKFGTVGLPFEGTDFRVGDDGEILIRGPGVMDGYHNQPEATAEALIDGWFHTGDIGAIDSDGYVTITDRKKDLFKTSGGKYVAPQIIEGQFKTICPYVSQFVVFGNQRKYVSAVVTLDPEAIAGWARQHGMAGMPYDEVVTSEAARAMVQDYIDRLNASLNRWETVKRFTILERDLTVDDGEVTPSLKVKRKVVQDHYRDQIEAMYP